MRVVHKGCPYTTHWERRGVKAAPFLFCLNSDFGINSGGKRLLADFDDFGGRCLAEFCEVVAAEGEFEK